MFAFDDGRELPIKPNSLKQNGWTKGKERHMKPIETLRLNKSIKEEVNSAYNGDNSNVNFCEPINNVSELPGQSDDETDYQEEDESVSFSLR